MANKIILSSVLYAGQDIASIELTRREGAGGYTITRAQLLEKGDGTMPADGLVIDPEQYGQTANDIYGTWTVTYVNDCIHQEDAQGAEADCVIVGASLSDTVYYEGQPITVAEGNISATAGFTFEGFDGEDATIDLGTTSLTPTFTVPADNGTLPYENQGALLTCPPISISVAEDVDCPALSLDSNLNDGDPITLSDLSGNNTSIYNVDLTGITFQLGVTSIDVPVSIVNQNTHFFGLAVDGVTPEFTSNCTIEVRPTATFDCSDLSIPATTVVLPQDQFNQIGQSMEPFITYDEAFVTSSGINITWPVWELGDEVSYDIQVDLTGSGLYFNGEFENGGAPVICNVTGTACKDDLSATFEIGAQA